MSTAAHHCLICGIFLSHQDGGTPALCAFCERRPAMIHPYWYAPGPVEIEARKRKGMTA